MGDVTYQRATELLEADLGDELVALDQAQGQCFGFNGVATSVWRLLASPRSAGEIEKSLMAEYDVEQARCRAELGDLLDDLVAKGLVRKGG